MPAKKKMPDQSVVSQGLPKKGGDVGAGDQITEDIKKFKLAKDKFSANIKKTIAPAISEKMPVVHTAKQSVSSVTSKLFDPELLKRLFKILVLILLLFGLFYIGSQIFTAVVRDTEETDDVIPIPSIGQFRPYRPSVYAEDELILKLDEDVKVLDRELSTTQLKETILNPPTLDFDINFEK